MASLKIVLNHDKLFKDSLNCRYSNELEGSIMSQCQNGQISYSYYNDRSCSDWNSEIFTAEKSKYGKPRPIMAKPGAFIQCGEARKEVETTGAIGIGSMTSILMVNAIILLSFV